MLKPKAFTIVEALLMLGLLTVFAMVAAALYIRQPAELNEDEAKWRSEGGDATRLSSGLPAVQDSSLAPPEMTSDTEIQLDKTAPAKQAP